MTGNHHPITRLVKQAMEGWQLQPGRQPVWLAFSGGLDSVVLAHVLHQLGYQPGLLHVNFGLRGEESQRDARFVTQLAADWGLPLLVHTCATTDFDAVPDGVQQRARQIRYQWFKEVLQQQPEGAVLCTAHHAHDQAETMLLHLGRGAGLSGAAGMPARHEAIIRPMLQASRPQVADYASVHGLTWVEDSSNAATDYLRNAIRHTVLPALEQCFPQFAHTMEANARRLDAAQQFASHALQRQLQRMQVIRGTEVHMPIGRLRHMPGLPYVVHEWIAPYGFTQAEDTDAVLHLLDAQSGKYHHNEKWQIIRHRQWLVIAPYRQPGKSGPVIVEAGFAEVQCPQGSLLLQQQAYSGQALPQAALEVMVDADAVQFPLILRPWQAGDYFFPLGMVKKKKLSRFLIDAKCSRTDKEKVWVLEDAAKRLVWVVGMRIDHRMRVQPGTQQVLMLQWKPS